MAQIDPMRVINSIRDAHTHIGENVDSFLQQLAKVGQLLDSAEVSPSSLARRLRAGDRHSVAEREQLVASLDNRDGSVLVCTAQMDGRILVAVLDSLGQRAIAAQVFDQYEHVRRIDGWAMADLLTPPASSEAATLRAALRAEQEESSIALHEQHPVSTARTFRTKYSLAAENGSVVRGLDAFATALETSENSTVLLANIDFSFGSALVALVSDLSAILSVMIVEPPEHTSPRSGQAHERNRGAP
jgi:hypothetical protein